MFAFSPFTFDRLILENAFSLFSCLLYMREFSEFREGINKRPHCVFACKHSAFFESTTQGKEMHVWQCFLTFSTWTRGVCSGCWVLLFHSQSEKNSFFLLRHCRLSEGLSLLGGRLFFQVIWNFPHEDEFSLLRPCQNACPPATPPCEVRHSADLRPHLGDVFSLR